MYLLVLYIKDNWKRIYPY